MTAGDVQLTLPAELLEQLAWRVADIIHQRASELARERLSSAPSSRPSPYMTVAEAADFLRCKRQRVDDLLSSGRLARYKDGGRTLLSRVEVEEYVVAIERRGGTRVTPGPDSRSESRIRGR